MLTFHFGLVHPHKVRTPLKEIIKGSLRHLCLVCVATVPVSCLSSCTKDRCLKVELQTTCTLGVKWTGGNLKMGLCARLVLTKSELWLLFVLRV